MYRVIVFLLVFLCNFVRGIQILSHIGTCKAVTDQGLIDLSPLARTDGKPRFWAIRHPDDNTKSYEFNPCYDYCYGNGLTEYGCQKVSVSEVTHTTCPPRLCFTGMGSASNALWEVSPAGFVTIYYSDPDTHLSIRVRLICTDTSTDTVTAEHCKDQCDTSIILVMRSTHSCPGVEPLPTPQPNTWDRGGLSVGSILCIDLLVLICLYLIGGFIYTICYKKATGRHRIPNLELWVLLPGLVVDGTRFLFCCCKTPSAPRTESTEYEQLLDDDQSQGQGQSDTT